LRYHPIEVESFFVETKTKEARLSAVINIQEKQWLFSEEVANAKIWQAM